MFLVATSRRNRKSRGVKHWRSALAAMALGLVLPSTTWAQYTYVPSNNQTGNWTATARWTGGPAGTVPNAVDATATVNLPASTAPTGNYNIQISNTAGAAITIGSLTVNNAANQLGNLRFGANGNGTLTFQSSTGPATYTENAAGVDDATSLTKIFAPVTFLSDTVITQNHALTSNVATEFGSTNNSPGGVTAASNITVTKEGAGNLTFSVAPTAPGTGFQGSLVVNNGAVRDEVNVFQNAASITVNNGGQYQIGTSTLANWNLGSGSVLTLNGQGKSTGVNPEGALRYQNNAFTTSFNNSVKLDSDSGIFVNANLVPVAPAPVTYGHLTLSQTVYGEGGLTKLGDGILELTAANTYAGRTIVSAGTLLVNNTSGSATGEGSVTVNAGATLAGSGTIDGSVSFVGGTLAAGNSPGTLHLGSTSFDAASILNYQLDTPGVVGSGINDLVDVTGDLTLDGTLNVEALSGFGVGTYRLFDYTGSLFDNGLDLGLIPGGFSYSIDTSVAHQVNLNVTAVPEASTMILSAMGVAGFGFGLLRRKRAAKVEA